jgi:hypothetical protein
MSDRLSGCEKVEKRGLNTPERASVSSCFSLILLYIVNRVPLTRPMTLRPYLSDPRVTAMSKYAVGCVSSDPQGVIAG